MTPKPHELDGLNGLQSLHNLQFLHDLQIADLYDENPEKVSVCEPLLASCGGRKSFYAGEGSVVLFAEPLF